MQYGYKPDPVPYVGANGQPIGSQQVSLYGHTFQTRSFQEMKAWATPLASGDVDLRPWCFAMNQYQLSSCTGNATVESLEILSKIAKHPGDTSPDVPLSRLFIYSMARTLAGDLSRDEGTLIRLCFDVLSTFGTCREDDPVNGWPYDPNLVFTSPSIMALRAAAGHKIHSYYQIQSTGQDRVNDVIAALRAYHPVVFGTQIANSFQLVNSAAPVQVPGPNDPMDGGHAMCLVGYVGGNFIVKNSWGPAWGAGGFCFITPEYLMWDQTFDLWVPTLGPNF